MAYGSWRRQIAVWFAIACPCLPGSAAAQGRTPAAASCEPETAARLSFLEERLEARRRYADVWWKGWGAVYGFGLVVEGTRAGLEDDRGERANQVVSAVKSSIGLARTFLAPPHAKDGSDELLTLPATPEACATRLARAEQMLSRNAEEADSRHSWTRHLANLGLNLAGAVIVAEAFDEPRGWASGAIGFAVGEAHLWSHPWQAREDWEAYRRSFPRDGSPRAPPTTWRVLPSAAGIRVVVEF